MNQEHGFEAPPGSEARGAREKADLVSGQGAPASPRRGVGATRRLPVATPGTLAAGVAVAAMVLASVLAVSSQLSSINVGEDLSGELAREALSHHRAARELQVITGELSRLGASLETLNFTPVMPKRLADRSLSLLGARLVVLRGRPAAEIRFEDAEGRQLTVFETELVKDLAKVAETRRQLAGMNIDLWRDEGLLFLLVSPGDSPAVSHGPAPSEPAGSAGTFGDRPAQR